MMEIEMEGKVKALNYKVKAMSRESPSQKASHVLETDLRAHWSTSTNTKEWILLELDEPCLLSHIRIYNKSVLEWEIAAGLRYKPETFVKVRPRCEAPRRDMIYPANYIPCRYVRISCMRGNPIAIFFIQLIGVSVTGLEPEFQPVVNHLLPQIILHKQDGQDLHLQLLQDMTNRLLVFLPQLEPELTSFLDAPEQNLRFLAMLAGPFYPILCIVNERQNARHLGNNSDSEASKNTLPSSSFTVSSNFEPRRSRNVYPSVTSTSSNIAFSPDAAFALLRKAYKDSDIGAVCRMASIILQRLASPVLVQEPLPINVKDTSVLDNSSGPELLNRVPSVDYSSLFGEEFQITDYHSDSGILNVLDIGAVEEGVLHVLYACASQPLLCRKLAENASEFWCALPLVQALLPALRPHVISLGDHFDDSFSSWKQPLVQQALSQIVATSCSPLYRPLLHACTCYLSSFSPSHAKAACILIDLCSSVLEPWMAQATAKIDLTIELLEDLLGTIQFARHSLPRARAALKYIILALSGHMDDILGKYKEVKHKILFLLEMLEPFLDPAINALKSAIAFGDFSLAFLENQEQACLVALNVIHTAVQKPDVLPSLESEWRRGSVAPSVLLSIVEPHMQLPPNIDLCKSPISENCDNEALSTSIYPSGFCHQEVSSKSNSQEEADGKVDVCEPGSRMDFSEDASLLFVPAELQTLVLTNVSSSSKDNTSDSNSHLEPKHDIRKHFTELFKNGLVLDTGFSAEYFNLQADYFQLVSYSDCELRASEFRRLASDLYSQNEITVEGHDAAIDALLLAAECYVNPFFMMSFRSSPKVMNLMNTEIKTTVCEISDFSNSLKKNCHDLEISVLENKRDKCVLQLLLEASELDRKFCRKMSSEEYSLYYPEETDEQVISLSPQDVQSTDAITLVRQNQALLCSFLIQRLKKKHQSMHEILMHCLGFLLHSATRLYCAPDEVISIISQSAEYLNGMLTSLYYQFKEGNLQLDPEKIHGIQRRWILLQRLVVASSSGDGLDFAFSGDQFRYGNLIPPSIWIQKISTFSCSSYPLVRFLGWMAISRIARQYTKERLFLASDLSQLTYLLSIYGDELAVVDNVINQNSEDRKLDKSQAKQDSSICQGFEVAAQQHTDQSFHVIYPDLRKFFPNLKRKFESFGDDILEAVGLQLRSLSSSLVPDILCWFSDFCSWPFSQNSQMSSQNRSDHLKGYVAKNAKAIILYILEAIIVEHMEAMVPEIPRLLQVLISLCGSSYCDVSFLDSVMRLLKPIISYSLKKVVCEEKILVDDSCLDFESVCFEDLFVYITQKNKNQDTSTEKYSSRALVIFIVASIFADLSFQRKREILQSLAFWADFTTFGPASSFHDYVSAFQNILDSCKILLVQTLKVFGVIPLQLPKSSDSNTGYLCDNNSEMNLCFLDDICHSSCSPKTSSNLASNNVDGITQKEEGCLSVDEIEVFCKDLENLIRTLIPTIEQCWNLHHRLAKKLIITATQCYMFSRCLSSIVPQVLNAELDSRNMSFSVKVIDQFPVHWRIALEGLAEIIMKFLEIHCWEVTSMMLNCLLGVPYCFRLDNVIDIICSVIKGYSSSAPKIAWRFRSDKWLSILLARGVHGLPESDGPLTDLFISLLSHPEPEQRFIALQHLGRLVGQYTGGEPVLHTSSVCNKLLSSELVLSVPDSSLSLLVPSTWDQVVLLASSDSLLPIRTRAMALLLGYIPYAAQHQLQSFLAAADSILYVLGKSSQPACEGPLLRLSLALIAGACLYSPEGSISLISQDVWRNIEAIGLSRTGKLGDMEKSTCEVLCSLRDGGVDAKEVLRKVLSTSSSKQVDADFGSTRESILQVLANITSVRSYFDMFSKIDDQKAMELEEAEIQLEILQNEQAVQESSKSSVEEMQIPWIASSEKDDNRLLQIKDLVHSLDKSKLREDLVSRRQKKLVMRRARQKYLEEAALQEEELMRELDRERTAEAEKEIERQRLLELERARTRELRHILDMEKERQTQRDLQRELEQAESGQRSSRRDFSTSTHNSRPRERYRERENGRAINEGSGRTSSGSLQADASAMGTVVLSNSRTFSGQPPTILQLRERQDDCGSSYEETFDGSKDSGDTGSVGDLDVMLESGGFGSTQRHGSSKGSKPRQVLERREGREKDGRREGACNDLRDIRMEMAHQVGVDEKPAQASSSSSSMSLAKMASGKFKGSAEKTLSAQEQRIKIDDVKKIMGPIADKFPVFCSDASISRYLRARSWNTKKAAKMLKATLKWRLEYKPEKIIWEDIAEEAITGKVYRASYFDKSGRTVLIMRPGVQNTSNVVGQLKHLVYCMEDATMTTNSSEQEQEHEQEKMVWLVDFEGWSMGNISVKAARETANVLQNHYPERLGLAILYNPPKVFESFWKIVRPFLESKTYKKTKFVYSSDPGSKKIMEELFDMDKLECSFGGRSSAGFDYESYMKWMKEEEMKRALLTSNNSETPSTSCPLAGLSNSDEEDDEEVATPAKEKAEEMPLSLRRFCEDDYF